MFFIGCGKINATLNIQSATIIAFLLISFSLILTFLTFALVSWLEGEKRALRVALGLAVCCMLLSLSALLPAVARLWLLLVLAALALAALILLLLPVGRIDLGPDSPRKRFDERDIVFARARLQPGSPEYESYYAMHPYNKAVDDRTRAKPGLSSPHSRYANLYHFASTDASFFLTGALREAVDGLLADEDRQSMRPELPPAKLTKYLKELARYYGALDVGVAALQPYHIYSHIGRGTGEYGAPIDLDHRYALAFTVEMDHAMVTAGPYPPIAMESARQYVESARVAVQLAAVLRELGYPARAHIDGNYRVIAPLVARDAGLGEIGRISLLMTPRLGPRVRLGVVTTRAELVPDGRRPFPEVIDFCTICEKCAQNCPSKSIPLGPRQEQDGVLRWRINPETCFHYWNVIGTDCARCIAVCPYSHPDNFFHNTVRWGVAHSGAFRRLALRIDDLFYGKHPAPHPAPPWTDVS